MLLFCLIKIKSIILLEINNIARAWNIIILLLPSNVATDVAVNPEKNKDKCNSLSLEKIKVIIPSISIGIPIGVISIRK